jgi:hypothetical protein
LVKLPLDMLLWLESSFGKLKNNENEYAWQLQNKNPNFFLIIKGQNI